LPLPWLFYQFIKRVFSLLKRNDVPIRVHERQQEFYLLVMKKRRQSQRVPSESIHAKVSSPLKREFMKALKQHPDFETITDFIEGAMSALVLQSRRKEKLVFPLEFVSDKSSDKVDQ
jgi:hypothetical protein